MAAPTTLVGGVRRPSKVQLEEYPYSDGRILMEADPHANSVVAMRNQLQWHFEGREDVYVAGSLAVYYRRGDRSAVVEPDVFVALGVKKRDRRSYRIWDEGGVVPAFVVEVASPSTSRRDATDKQETYERMGVQEYWRFDPAGRRIPEGLVGWRLDGGRYEGVRSAGADGWFRSQVLELELRAEGWLLRFRDPRLGRDLMTHSETSRTLQVSEHGRDEAERRAETEAAARRTAERRAETEAVARRTAERRAETEALARRTAERERDAADRRIRDLEARLRLDGKSG